MPNSMSFHGKSTNIFIKFVLLESGLQMTLHDLFFTSNFKETNRKTCYNDGLGGDCFNCLGHAMAKTLHPSQ